MAGYKVGWMRRNERGGSIDFGILMEAVSNVWPTVPAGQMLQFTPGIPHKGMVKAIADEYNRLVLAKVE